MTVPHTVQQIIEQYIVEIGRNPDHQLKPSDRLNLYNSFGPLDSDLANHVYAWLGLLTARKVLPLWQRSEIPDDYPESWRDLPNNLIDLAEAVFKGLASEELLSEAADDAYHIIGGENYSEQYDFIASAALGSTILTRNREPFKYCRLTENDYDNDAKLGVYEGDVASAAIKAYAGICDEEVGLIETLDANRSLEFWEWWLTVAIPQAWELGQQSFDSKPIAEA